MQRGITEDKSWKAPQGRPEISYFSRLQINISWEEEYLRQELNKTLGRQ